MSSGEIEAGFSCENNPKDAQGPIKVHFLLHINK